ncbi:hypothetical protein B0H65DRAFT_566416 [Neurospora tetraspora]|uniref:Uncharacterized protein n=1 Tax=Neurospora tetraspora TaxID=94610 RepID=A0AAE0MJ43_9PEZI|nr:hypothetical protein B0H65DRAFT_566416 [Neurospora tetraspora]
MTWSLALPYVALPTHQIDGAMHRTCQYQHKATSLYPMVCLCSVLACHPPFTLNPSFTVNVTVASCLSIQCRFRHGRMFTPKPSGWMELNHLVTQDSQSVSHSPLTLTLTSLAHCPHHRLSVEHHVFPSLQFFNVPKLKRLESRQDEIVAAASFLANGPPKRKEQDFMCSYLHQTRRCKKTDCEFDISVLETINIVVFWIV